MRLLELRHGVPSVHKRKKVELSRRGERKESEKKDPSRERWSSTWAYQIIIRPKRKEESRRAGKKKKSMEKKSDRPVH